MAERRTRPKPRRRHPRRDRPAPRSHAALDAHVARAIAMADKAHAPYSDFHVGAVLVGRSGRTYDGCNVENASYGLCLCAERTAIATAVAAGEKQFTGIVVSTPSVPPSPPCGMCRQVMAEFCEDLAITLVNPKGDRIDTTLAKLFPRGFTAKYF